CRAKRGVPRQPNAHLSETVSGALAQGRSSIILTTPAKGWGGRDMKRTALGRLGLLLMAVGLIIAVTAALAGSAEPASDRKVIHILNRVAFGPTLEEVHYIKTTGIEHYIAEQLDPDSIPESVELRYRLAQLDTLKLNAVQLRQLYGPLPRLRGFKPNPELD